MSATRPRTDRRRTGPARDPAGAASFLDLGASHAAAGRFAEASKAYERAEAADPDDFRAPFSLATIDLQLGRPAQALPRLRRVTGLKPDLFEAQHNLAAVAQTLELWAEAAQAYERALALRPDATETRRNLALVLASLGRIDDASAHHRRLAADPGDRGLGADAPGPAAAGSRHRHRPRGAPRRRTTIPHRTSSADPRRPPVRAWARCWNAAARMRRPSRRSRPATGSSAAALRSKGHDPGAQLAARRGGRAVGAVDFSAERFSHRHGARDFPPPRRSSSSACPAPARR